MEKNRKAKVVLLALHHTVGQKRKLLRKEKLSMLIQNLIPFSRMAHYSYYANIVVV